MTTRPKISRQILFIVLIIFAGIGGVATYWYKERPVATNIQSSIIASGYKEHTFTSEYRDLGFTHRAWRQILKSEDTLVKTAEPIPLPQWQFISNATDSEAGKVGNDTYEFKSWALSTPIYDRFEVYKNGQEIFHSKMDYGADGPFIQRAIIDDKPAFTFRKSCAGSGDNCEHEIYYNGHYISDEFKVKNPRHLFSYRGKLGFIIQTETGDAIFFNGKVISNTYDKIHFMNCCSIQEILPTVYDNGVLLFYVVQNKNKDYLIEINLSNHL